MDGLRVDDAYDPPPLQGVLRGLLRPRRMASAARASQISVEPGEHDDHDPVKAEIPGVRSVDIDVPIDRNQVTISAEVNKEADRRKADRSLHTGRLYGYASQTLALGGDIDGSKADAWVRDGVLGLRLPKKAASGNGHPAIGWGAAALRCRRRAAVTVGPSGRCAPPGDGAAARADVT